MAVYTDVNESAARELLAQYDLGELVSIEGITSGIDNSNFFVTTDRMQLVLTVFERFTHEQLPFYLELCEHLAEHGCRVAKPQRSRDGRLHLTVCGKPCMLANRIIGQGRKVVSAAVCRSMGELLARMHLAAASYPRRDPNPRDLDWMRETIVQLERSVGKETFSFLNRELEYLESVCASPEHASLPASACHLDLFVDNTLIADPEGENAHVAGVFDFFFAGCAPWVLDLAVCVNDWCIERESGKLNAEKTAAFLAGYQGVRKLEKEERALWRPMLRKAALRFYTSRLYDWHNPRPASLLVPHDPEHFARILRDRAVCELTL